jgi:hypothetical protein
MVQTAGEKYVALIMDGLLEYAKKVGEGVNRVQPGRVVWQTDTGYPSLKLAKGFMKRHSLSLRKCTGAYLLPLDVFDASVRVFELGSTCQAGAN